MSNSFNPNVGSSDSNFAQRGDSFPISNRRGPNSSLDNCANMNDALWLGNPRGLGQSRGDLGEVGVGMGSNRGGMGQNNCGLKRGLGQYGDSAGLGQSGPMTSMYGARSGGQNEMGGGRNMIDSHGYQGKLPFTFLFLARLFKIAEK